MMGLMKQVPLNLGSWEDHVDLNMVPMDGFDVILDTAFLVENKPIPIPVTNSFSIMGDQSFVLPM